METQVQVFMEEETKELIYDSEKLEEWKSKVQELGLNAQLELCKEDKSPIPFTYMKESMVAMFEELCPASTRVQDYNITPIPIEVLGVISLAEKEGYFEGIEIWYDDKKPDPILVGFKNGKKYLMARWGAEKADFGDLYKEAKKRLMARIKTEATETLNRMKNNLANVEEIANKKLRGEWVSWNY
jgi:hypothetical protein